MAKLYYVIDSKEDATSWSPETESGEHFRSEGAAIKRAKALAQSEPGRDFYICEVTMVVQAGVKPVTVDKV
jgi:hypothetical protein